jgi:hypothetical protein
VLVWFSSSGEQLVYKAGIHISDAQLPRSDVGNDGGMGLEGGAVSTWASPLGLARGTSERY